MYILSLTNIECHASMSLWHQNHTETWLVVLFVMCATSADDVDDET